MQKIAPDAPGQMLRDPHIAKAGRAMEAMMKMIKLDLVQLERAYSGGQDAGTTS